MGQGYIIHPLTYTHTHTHPQDRDSVFLKIRFRCFFDPADTQAIKQSIKQTIYVSKTLLYEKEKKHRFEEISAIVPEH
jgi:hypothetical protein